MENNKEKIELDDEELDKVTGGIDVSTIIRVLLKKIITEKIVDKDKE